MLLGAALKPSGAHGLQAGLFLSLTLCPRPAERPFCFLEIRQGYTLGKYHKVREVSP